MRYILIILSIIFSFTVYSCSSKDESASDTSTNSTDNSTVEVTAVTTIAGTGSKGLKDSSCYNCSVIRVGTSASFRNPKGITTDGTNLYVVDTWNHTIRMMNISTGQVSTLVGSPGFSSSTYAVANDEVDTTHGEWKPSGTFYFPQGITIDGTNLYVADTDNHLIRKIEYAPQTISEWVVTTLAGKIGSLGSANGTGKSASFWHPRVITKVGTNLYILSDSNIGLFLRQIVISTGVVTTVALAGSPTFNSPEGITTDGTNLYVADTSNHLIRKIVISTAVVTTLAGTGSIGSADGTGASASFNYPKGITIVGTNLYVVDTWNHLIRKIEM